MPPLHRCGCQQQKYEHLAECVAYNTDTKFAGASLLIACVFVRVLGVSIY